MSDDTPSGEVEQDPSDPSLYELNGKTDYDPTGPTVNGWELETIKFDCPEWSAPNGERVKVVRQGTKHRLFVRGEVLKHGSYERADSIAKAVEWMRENAAPESHTGSAEQQQSNLQRWLA